MRVSRASRATRVLRIIRIIRLIRIVKLYKNAVMARENREMKKLENETMNKVSETPLSLSNSHNKSNYNIVRDTISPLSIIY